MTFDLILRGGTFFDGTGAPGLRRDIGIRDGLVAEIAPSLAAHEARAARVIDVEGQWVMPGFIDNHTHYDAELLLAPGLGESVRHGVTTVCIGSCSLSTILSTPEDCADMFSRVEALPREHVLGALADKSWWSPEAYIDKVESLDLGPNVMSYLGHSDLRVSVMGLERATSPDARPTEAELTEMEAGLQRALDAGLLGLSCMTNPWDKMGGDRVRSRALPSTYARVAEYRRFHEFLRERDAILQSAPNITTKYNAILYLLDSAPLWRSKALKTTLITLADVKAEPWLSRAVARASEWFNARLGANVRWQSVPMPFEVYADGIDLVVFEEFGAGEEALHLVDQIARNALFRDPAYRRRFRKDYDKRFGPRVWHRDLYDAEIVSAPDASLAGRTFGELSDERGEHPVDTFLDLVIAHGTALRWRTTIANHRPERVREIAASPSVHVGFADSGAHIRNMAFYNFPLHLLRMARDAEARGEPFMSVAAAIHRVTGEIGRWFGVDAGELRVGARADIAVVDPAALDDSLDAYHEAEVDVFGGLSRMVRRNDATVRATIIGGGVAYERGRFAEDFGRTPFGRFLRRGRVTAPRSRAAADRASVGAPHVHG